MPHVYTDQLQNTIQLKEYPRRIISLVPSQTELLFDLGLEEEVVGITKFCIHPEKWRREKTIVGGTKKFDFDAIAKLQPDLIIANKEENYLEGIKQLQQSYPVWMSDIVHLEDSYAMIHSLGELTNRASQANEWVQKIEKAFTQPFSFVKKRVLYLIWRQPWMAAGEGTFISSMLETIGMQNAVEEERYPQLNNDQLQRCKPDIVFLSSEPYPFQSKHIAELNQLLPKAQVVLVDGEMFSWYGSRLAQAPDYFRQLHLQLNSHTH